MKTFKIYSGNNSHGWPIRLGLISFALLGLAAAPTQAADCDCSSTGSACGAGSATCGSGTSAEISQSSACSCGSAQASSGTRTQNQKQALEQNPTPKDTSNTARNGPPDPRFEYAWKAGMALLQKDFPTAEKILLEHDKQLMPAANEQLLKANVALGLMNLSAGLKKPGQQGTRKEVEARALALVNEAIGNLQGKEKAAALVWKAQIVKQIMGANADVKNLIDEASELDPQGQTLHWYLMHAKPTS